MANTFLGLDTNAYIPELLLSLLFMLDTCLVEPEFPGQSGQSCHLKFDEFFVENIHSHLVNFNDARTFRFRSFLLRMFIAYNEEDL